MSPSRALGSKSMSAFEVYRKTNKTKISKPRIIKKKKVEKYDKKKNLLVLKPTQVAVESNGHVEKNAKKLKKKVLPHRKDKIQHKKLKQKNRKAQKVDSSFEQTDESEEDMHLTPCEHNDSTGDSIEEGRKLFAWLIEPIDTEEFFSNVWEKRPLHIKRNISEYYKALLSMQMIDDILRSNFLQFTNNVDVTSYRNGKRETHNPPGRALPSIVWHYYKKGCSVRMLNPQTFSPKLGLLSATLQDYFGSFVGANSYLTPPGTQGFAPHYDDIEAFILQLEGKKNWKLYAPRSEEETLPCFSSPNFSQDEIGDPIMEVTLSPGDLLYFPRGIIHQASTVPGYHSLHITLSCYQNNSWGDYFEKLLPAALTIAMQEDVEFRRGLPTDYLQHIGLVHSERESIERKAFFEHMKGLLTRLTNYLPVDAAADQMATQFLHDSMPPFLSADERRSSYFDGGEKLDESGIVVTCQELQPNSTIKLLRANILRVVKEENVTETEKEESSPETVQIYHCASNTLVHHEMEPQSFAISSDLAPGVEFLIHSYPQLVTVESLPLDTLEMKMEIAVDLWKRGLLLTNHQ